MFWLLENVEKFEMISTPMGSWIRSRLLRDRIQLPVGVEIISNFSKFSCVLIVYPDRIPLLDNLIHRQICISVHFQRNEKVMNAGLWLLIVVLFGVLLALLLLLFHQEPVRRFCQALFGRLQQPPDEAKAILRRLESGDRKVSVPSRVWTASPTYALRWATLRTRFACVVWLS